MSMSVSDDCQALCVCLSRMIVMLSLCVSLSQMIVRLCVCLSVSDDCQDLTV